MNLAACHRKVKAVDAQQASVTDRLLCGTFHFCRNPLQDSLRIKNTATEAFCGEPEPAQPALDFLDTVSEVSGS